MSAGAKHLGRVFSANFAGVFREGGLLRHAHCIVWEGGSRVCEVTHWYIPFITTDTVLAADSLMCRRLSNSAMVEIT